MKSVSSETRKPYSGASRSLVIAIDVGTTFSGVSYAILEPGEIPKIHGVTRFPGQEHVAGNTKIPSIIYYDRHGKMMVAGAEADNASMRSQAEDEDWIKTDLFKLRLRPRTMQLNMNGMRLGPLPRKKTAVHVFGDFLAYMYRCTRNFIIDTHGNGAALWNAIENDIQFVLSHPNGWEGVQQSKMRQAAVYGGLIPDTDEGRARIRFVTEGEASLHACVLSGLATDVLQNPSKHGFLIADAGGGTLDISAYAIRASAPLVMEEIAPPDCVFAGSIFVSKRAREFLAEKLKNSKYGTTDSLDHITLRFDETTKRLFRDRKELQFIPFGSPLDKDLQAGIRNGQLKLTGEEVADLFEPSVSAAVSAIKAQIELSNGLIRSIFLVGGYAASPWLFSQLQERLAPYKVAVSRPDMQTSKAVADGAIGFYCDHHVSARMSKFMYGVEFLRQLDPKNPDHLARKERLCELPSGPKLLPDAFDCILNRGVRVKESTVFTRKYCTELTSLSMLSVFEVEIWCYRGGNVVPQWIERQADEFSTLCVVRADLSPLSGSAEPKAGKNGKTYWTIVFSIEIHFGLTEFRSRIKWVDNGKTRYGPASIIYNERGMRAEEEEAEAYPEDDINSAAPSPRGRDHLRSEPASRARTPVAEHFQPTGSLDRGLDNFEPPPAATPAPRAPIPEPVVEVQPPPPVEPPREPTPPPVEEPPPPPRTPASVKKGKKAKTPAATPKAKSINEPPLESIVDKTPGPKDSALWENSGNDPDASVDLLSPITPTSTKPPAGFSSAAPTPRELGKDLDDTLSVKGSPALGAKRSPLAATEPVIAAEAIVEPSPLSREIVEPAPTEPPTPAAPVVEPEPPTPSTPTANSVIKKRKKKASVATPFTAPEQVPETPVEPTPTPAPAAAEPEPAPTPAEEKKEEAEAKEPPKAPTPPPATNVATSDSWFDNLGSTTQPEAAPAVETAKNDPLTLPEVSSSNKEDDPWGNDSWGLNGEKKGEEGDAGGWGSSFGSSKTPTTAKTPSWGAPKTPSSATSKPSSPWGAKPASTASSSPWGKKAETPKPAASSPWGKPADQPAKSPTPSLFGASSKTESPAKPTNAGWSSKLTGWGASAWGAATKATSSTGPWDKNDEEQEQAAEAVELAARAKGGEDLAKSMVGDSAQHSSEPAPEAAQPAVEAPAETTEQPPKSPAKEPSGVPAEDNQETVPVPPPAAGNHEEQNVEEKTNEPEAKDEEKKDEKAEEPQPEAAAEPEPAEDKDDFKTGGAKGKKKKKKR